MPRLGLIGYPLSHSFSKRYFTEKFQKEGIHGWEYELYPIPAITELPTLLNSEPELVGLNVTIPYKQQVIPYLDELDPAAAEIGAVNTIAISRHADKRPFLKGYNTDAAGFERTFLPLLRKEDKGAFILGTGGASRAVQYVLKKNGIPFCLVSRGDGLNTTSKTLRYEEINDILLQKYNIIINTTPLGMYPDTETAPDIPYHLLSERNLLYDLVYNPEETLFLRNGKERGARIRNGLPMLYAQAEEAWKVFNNE